MTTAASKLLGMKLVGGWEVVEAVAKTGSQTGSFFSKGYLARNEDGRVAFLKAMDFSEATKASDFARAIEQIARQFNFERDILEYCKDRKLSNVVRSIGGGLVDVDGAGNPLGNVQYFLFEPADGDIRRVIDNFDQVTLSWVLGVLHETAIGLRQLHLALIAHQDVKPSNVLAFAGGDKVKIADLGCASVRGQSCPRDVCDIPGQVSYAPPEQLYSYVHPDWLVRRIGSDMYQIGSLGFFLLCGIPMNAMLETELESQFHWGQWVGTYADVLPRLEFCFAKIKTRLLSESMPEAHKLIVLLCELCEPNYKQRGNRTKSAAPHKQYSLETYVSRLGNLRSASLYAAKKVIR
jgi:eukaryotic-like serine/threonine-protein kinase